MYQEYIEILKKNLDDYRFYHSMCVAQQAVHLAEIYGCDKEKAYIAGLLHDVTKNYSEKEHLQLLKKFGIILTGTDKYTPKLWHGISGAAFCEKEIGITDSEIISAIRYHSTGKADMSLLEKVIYVADYTSADRKYPDVEHLRKLADKSLDDAVIYSLKYTVRDLLNKELPVHEDTVAAYNFFVLKGEF